MDWQNSTVFTFCKLIKIRSKFPQLFPHVCIYRRKDKAPHLYKRTAVYSASHYRLFCNQISSIYSRVWKYTYIPKCSGVVQSRQLTNSCYITAHNAFHPRIGQSSGTLALRKLCTNYTCKIVTDIKSGYCMQQIAYWEANLFQPVK